MCSRFAQSNRWSKAKAFEFAKDIDETRSRFNIVYTESALIILKPGTDYTVEDARLWLMAPWSKSIKESLQYSTGNAKSETIFELKSFKEPILTSRCVIPCDAIFESIGQSGSKQPFALRLRDNEPFGMAGICSRWNNPENGSKPFQLSPSPLTNFLPNTIRNKECQSFFLRKNMKHGLILN